MVSFMPVTVTIIKEQIRNGKEIVEHTSHNWLHKNRNGCFWRKKCKFSSFSSNVSSSISKVLFYIFKFDNVKSEEEKKSVLIEFDDKWRQCGQISLLSLLSWILNSFSCYGSDKRNKAKEKKAVVFAPAGRSLI